jgi:hypothetical protein
VVAAGIVAKEFASRAAGLAADELHKTASNTLGCGADVGSEVEVYQLQGHQTSPEAVVVGSRDQARRVSVAGCETMCRQGFGSRHLSGCIDRAFSLLTEPAIITYRP